MNDCIWWLGLPPPPSLTSPDISLVCPGVWWLVLPPSLHVTRSPCWPLVTLSCSLCLRCHAVTATPTATPRLQAGPDWELTLEPQSLTVSESLWATARAWPGWGLLRLVQKQVTWHGYWPLMGQDRSRDPASHVSGLATGGRGSLLGLPGLARTRHLSLPREKYYDTQDIFFHRSVLILHFTRGKMKRNKVHPTSSDSYFVGWLVFRLLRG